MKRIQTFFLLAALALLSLSCNKEAGNDVSVTDAGDIRLNAVVSEMATKATTNESGVTTFEAGDKLTLYAWTGAADPTAATVKMVVNGMVNIYDGQAWKPNTQMRWRNVRDNHYFVGIYPKHTVTSLVNDDVALNPAAEAYEQSDLLVARRLEGLSAQNDGITVDLVFDHMMAKFNLNLRYRNQWGTSPCPSAVTIQAAQSGKINYLTGVITPGEKSTQALNKVTSAQFTSLVMPQGGIRDVVLTIDGKDYTYTHTEDIKFEAGKVTTLSLLVGKDLITLNDNTVEDWTDGGSSVSPDAPEQIIEQTRPLTMRALVDGTSVTFTNRSNAPVSWITNDGRSGVISTGNMSSVSLDEGQRVWFMGEGGNEPYGDGTSTGSSHIAVNKDCQVYGNVMSLLTPDYSTATTLSAPKSFSYLFSGQVHLKNKADESLLLPATTLTKGCYKNMFAGCTGLSNLTVLGTDTSAAGSTDGWLDGVSENLSIVTAQPTIWPVAAGVTVYETQAGADPVKIFKAPMPKTGLAYNKNAQALVTAGTSYDSEVTLEYSTDGATWSTSVSTATNAGSYTVYTRIQESGKVILTLPASIAKINPVVTAPTPKSGLTYNGNNQALVNAASTTGGTLQYSLNNSSWNTSVPTGKNAGSYTVYYKVVGGTNYNDVAARSVSASIAKKTPSFSVSASSVSFSSTDAVDATKTVTITYDGDGTLSASSNNTSLATVSRSDKTLTITRKSIAEGSCTITVSATAGTNYAAPSSKTINVSLALGDTGKPLQDSSYGDYVGSNGKAYSSKAEMPSGTSDVGFVIYKNGKNGYVIGPRQIFDASSKEDHSSWAKAAGNFYVQNLNDTQALNWVIGSKSDYGNCGISDSSMGSFFTVLSTYGYASVDDQGYYPVAEPNTIFTAVAAYSGFYTFTDTTYGLWLVYAYPIIKF